MPPLAAAAAAASSSTSRCGPFACRGGAEQRARVQAPAAAADSRHGCGRPLGRAAGIVGGGIAAAFFASLERCACVEVRTADDLVPDDCTSGRDAEGAPLMMMQHDDAGAGNRATGRKQSRRTAAPAGSAAGKGRRGGGFVRCCESTK